MLTAAAAPEAGRDLLAAGRLCANARYNAVGYQPWCDQREGVERVTVDPNMATYGEVNLNYWFYGHQALKGVADMGSLADVRQMRHAFSGCKVAHDHLGGRRMGAARARERVSDVPAVRLARGRRRDGVVELRGGGVVHAD